jgi:hypothetical protein
MQAKIKYYGTLAATFFVLLLSTEHISEALKVVEKFTGSDSSVGTWFAAAGLQIFEVLTGMGVADLIARRKGSKLVLFMLIMILIVFFGINVAGNILYAFSNMIQVSGRELTMDMIIELDNLKKFWVFWAAIPIPLMGVAGISVQAIFKLDLEKKEEKKVKDNKIKSYSQSFKSIEEVKEFSKEDQDRILKKLKDPIEGDPEPKKEKPKKKTEPVFWDDGVKALQEIQPKEEEPEKKK